MRRHLLPEKYKKWHYIGPVCSRGGYPNIYPLDGTVGFVNNYPAGQGNCPNPLTHMIDKDRISPYNINKISRRKAMRIKNNIN